MDLRSVVKEERMVLTRAIEDSWGFDKLYQHINQLFVKLIREHPHDTKWDISINSYTITYFLDGLESSYEELTDYFKQHDITVEAKNNYVMFTFEYEG